MVSPAPCSPPKEVVEVEVDRSLDDTAEGRQSVRDDFKDMCRHRRVRQIVHREPAPIVAKTRLLHQRGEEDEGDTRTATTRVHRVPTEASIPHTLQRADGDTVFPGEAPLGIVACIPWTKRRPRNVPIPLPIRVIGAALDQEDFELSTRGVVAKGHTLPVHVPGIPGHRLVQLRTERLRLVEPFEHSRQKQPILDGIRVHCENRIQDVQPLHVIFLTEP